MLVTLRSHLKVSDQLLLLIFVAATRFHQRLIVDLALVDACVVRRYNTSQISQRVTHKSSKGLQNIARVSLLYLDKLDWNPKRFHGLGPYFKNSAESDFCDFRLVDSNFRLIELGKFWPLFLQSARTWSLKHTPLSNALHIDWTCFILSLPTQTK